MKKIFLFCLLVHCGNLFPQGIPPYNVNVCTSSSHGYYFMDATIISQTVTGNPTQIIMDSTGQVIWYCPLAAGGGDFKLQPNGQMSYLQNNKFHIMDSTFTIVDSVRCIGYTNDGHDLQILPNGHFLVLGIETIMMDLSTYYYFGSNHNLPGSYNAAVKYGVVQEQDQNHNVVFEWHFKDHTRFSDVDPWWLFTPNVVDFSHCNAVELDDDGNILVSSRHLNEITKINRSDSSVIWRLGGNANQFTFVNDTAMFKGQHDIRRIANGNVTLWDNGSPNPFHFGSAKEYQLDEVNHTATLAWHYTQDSASYSIAIGNTQRLDNGNTLIDFGMTDLHQEMFHVVDPSGNKVFELQFDDTLRSYRAFNYLTLPWRLPRTTINCVMIGNQYYLDAGSGHSSYLWSTGATTQMIPVTAADTFTVFVPCGNGGFMRSYDFVVTDVNNPCGTGIGEVTTTPSFSVYPIPAADFISIRFNDPPTFRSISLHDISGRELKTFPSLNEQLTIPIEDLSPGIYLLRAGTLWVRFEVVRN